MATSKQPHILVVEDDLAVRDVLRRYLQQQSYDVTVAADGTTGLAAARDLAPDLIVLDVMLPQMNGLEICRQLRETDGSAERSHEQVLSRPGRPNDVRKVLATCTSGRCRLRHPAG